MDVPFGTLAPDQEELTPGTMMVADGVVPLRDGYGPFPGLTVSATATALSGAPRGLYAYTKADGTWDLVAGTATTIEKMASDYTWSSIDTGLTPTSNDDFSFARFGTKLLYTNTTDGMRVYDVESGGAASAVAAAKNPRWIFVCGNILFGLNCLNSAGSRDNRLIRSSAFSDHTNWTTKGADYQPLEEGGPIIWGGPISDSSALILQSRMVRLLQVGNVGNALWGIQSLSQEFGSVGYRSVVSFDGMVFWLATDGFRMFSQGGGIQRIGAGFIDQWFLSQVDQANLELVQGTIDPFRKNVLWRYKSNSVGSTTVFEDIIGYNWAFNKWFTLTVETAYLAYLATPAVTWDAYGASTTWDTEDITWDSRALSGGQPLFGALNGSYKFGTFSGSYLAATLETATFDSRTTNLVSWAKPIDDSPDGTLSLGVKDTLSGTTTWKTGVAKVSSGRVPLRGRGIEIAFKRSISAGSTWTYAKGVDYLDVKPGGPK